MRDKVDTSNGYTYDAREQLQKGEGMGTTDTTKLITDSLVAIENINTLRDLVVFFRDRETLRGLESQRWEALYRKTLAERRGNASESKRYDRKARVLRRRIKTIRALLEAKRTQLEMRLFAASR